ncbi:MAG: anhydro-N-acetylmuramic acid kinase [Campylobacterota bacterium]|nr:anhydro-N-acetylmuramic acid kinase [Campylobacterota bacterium]
MPEFYIGVMSGTSLDGIDVVLCEIDSLTCKERAFIEYPFAPLLKSELLHVIHASTTLEAIGILDHQLGTLFSEAINALIIREKLDRSCIKAIGLHAQTLWHQPHGASPFTMQLGDPNIVSVQTQISVVSDFRRRDVALGGQGAPFAPAFHQFLYADVTQKTAVLNIGGMANITILGERLIGYDTGPGNVLMDYWITKSRNMAYDKNGEWAESGSVNEALLSSMLNDSYFSKAYPKSTGREHFNSAWLETHISSYESSAKDIQATLLALSVVSIANELKKFELERLLVCGGGGKNRYLLKCLKEALPHINIELSHHSDALEAMAFAWLAYKRVHREKVALSAVTGASEDTILGGIYG